ncbi:LCP family protein [Leifsonia kafniensis]|uniref:LCP family protein n=1 Tax=Leifsonia kafniensis TaxID=475957 RepID=A0ABP7L2T5_9MICO
MTDDASKTAVPIARHQKRLSVWRSRVRPLIQATAITLAVLLVSGASVASIAFAKLSTAVSNNAVDISNGTEEPVPPAATLGAFEGGFAILAVGADNAEGQFDADERHGGTLNDVNILFHVSADHQSAVALSLPRDLVIPQPDCVDPVTGEEFGAVSAQPLNEAYGRGGLGCVKSTIEELTGLSIPYAAVFTFAGTIAMSDAVGGVPICLDEAITDPESGLDLPAGTSVVSGQQALSYLRARKNVGDGSDLSRISSQQAYMSSLMRVMKSSETLTNVPKLLNLATAAAENVSLSESLAHLNTMASMALTLKDLDLDKLVFAQFPVVEDPDNHNKVVPDEELSALLMAKIAADEPFTLSVDSLSTAVTLDPAVPVTTPTAPEDGSTDAATTDPTTDAAATTAPTPGPEIINGLKGQLGSQQTCSVAN